MVHSLLLGNKCLKTQVLGLQNSQELENVGGREELDRMVKEHNLATTPRK